MGAASELQLGRYLARERVKAAIRLRAPGLERVIDKPEFDGMAPSTQAFEAGRPVARLVELLGNARVGDGFATGFLVDGPMVVTNWHVLERAGDAVGVGAHFGYQSNELGMMEAGTVFELDPRAFFYSNESLDIALVGVKTQSVNGLGQTPLSAFSRVRLIPTQGKILAGQPISIIQHPAGRPKQWAVRMNRLVREPMEEDLFLEYTTDTLPGSSGSPAFNSDWEMVAVHHSGVPRIENGEILRIGGGVWQPGMPDSAIDWVANEGVRVSKIIAHLKSVALADPPQQRLLVQLLNNATDPLESAMADADSNKPISSSATHLTPPTTVAPHQIIVHGTANFYFHPTGVDVVRRAGDQSPSGSVDLASVSAESKIRFDPDYAGRAGYDTEFLPGYTVPMPIGPSDQVMKSGSKEKILKYHHFSLSMHKSRRFCVWAASNVNYDKTKRWRSRKELGTDAWKLDPRIAGEKQIEGAELYDPAKKFDQGHIIRRDDVAWGDTKQEEEFGNSDSFHYTNCTPQHEEFNRAVFQFDGLWGGLENHIATQAGYLKNKLVVFAGPVLANDDPTHDFGLGEDIQIPIEFWKVIVTVENADTNPALRAYGFILSQQEAIAEHGWENRFRAGRFREQQVALATITERTGVTFDAAVLACDPLANDRNEGRGRRLRSFADVKLA
jgi:endonuclease G